MISKIAADKIPKNMLLQLSKSRNRWDWYADTEERIICVGAIQKYKQYFFLRNVYCLPEYRNNKYGSKMVKHLQDIYANILLDCPPELTSFYEKLGFKFVSVRIANSKKYHRMKYNA